MLQHYTVTVAVSTKHTTSWKLILASFIHVIFYWFIFWVCDSMVLLFFYVNETFSHVTATVPTWYLCKASWLWKDFIRNKNKKQRHLYICFFWNSSHWKCLICCFFCNIRNINIEWMNEWRDTQHWFVLISTWIHHVCKNNKEKLNFVLWFNRIIHSTSRWFQL